MNSPLLKLTVNSIFYTKYQQDAIDGWHEFENGGNSGDNQQQNCCLKISRTRLRAHLTFLESTCTYRCSLGVLGSKHDS